MSTNKLVKGDAALIAKCLNVDISTVSRISTGDRGKRGTDNQEAIKKAIELRNKQNEKLQEYCKKIALKKVSPTYLTHN